MQIEKYKINIPVILPEVPSEKDACTYRLIAALEAKDGISRVHVDDKSNSEPAKICIHYNPNEISLSRIEQMAIQAGAEITNRYGHKFFQVAGIRHQRHAQYVSEELMKTLGVVTASASVTGAVQIEFDHQQTNGDKLIGALGRLGLRKEEKKYKKDHDRSHAEPLDRETSDHIEHAHEEHRHGHFFGERSELYAAIISAVCLVTGFVIEHLSSLPLWVSLGFYIGAYCFGGFFSCLEAFKNLRAKRFEIDTLMIVAAVGAASLGKWAEGALLLCLFSLGHALEHFAMGRAKRAIEALGDLAPKTAHVIRLGNQTEVSIENIEIGETVLVKPNERIPVDGFVIKGNSSVNQAPVTGESVPVDKWPVENPERSLADSTGLSNENRVFAGTINGLGLLEVKVTKISSESTLARVVKMVAEAQAQASPTQQLTDRFERYFVPAVLVSVILLLFAFTVINEPFESSFYRAMAVLVAASPCALAISTPSAVLSGIARAGRGGVLIKGGAALENLGNITSIAFDKTGTLTEGKPRLTDIVCAEGISEEWLLRVAYAVETKSDHPLARAIVTGVKEKLGEFEIPVASEIQSLSGRGIKAVVEQQKVVIGKPVLFQEIDGLKLTSEMESMARDLESAGRTTMVIRSDDQYLGVLGVMDSPRENALKAIESLRSLGILRMVMLSGDNQTVASAVAKQVGIKEAIGDLLPDAKVSTIKKLREGNIRVAMVGDGVNDAPAMASANVGIAMGAAGSDVALETADVALMTDDLNHLAFAVGLSRQASRIIKQNLWVSLGVVALLVPATLFGLGIGPAVVVHEGSTLVVVFNALRLLAFMNPFDSNVQKTNQS